MGGKRLGFCLPIFRQTSFCWPNRRPTTKTSAESPGGCWSAGAASLAQLCVASAAVPAVAAARFVTNRRRETWRLDLVEWSVGFILSGLSLTSTDSGNQRESAKISVLVAHCVGFRIDQLVHSRSLGALLSARAGPCRHALTGRSAGQRIPLPRPVHDTKRRVKRHSASPRVPAAGPSRLPTPTVPRRPGGD